MLSQVYRWVNLTMAREINLVGLPNIPNFIAIREELKYKTIQSIKALFPPLSGTDDPPA